MSCQCYLGAVAMEYAESDLVTASTCALFTDNEGHYDSSLTYIPSGSGHNDRLFGKRKITVRGSNGSYWYSEDYGTLISTDSGASCPGVINDTDYVPGFDYGFALTPSSYNEYSSPVLGSDLLTYAESHATYGSWQPRHATATLYFSPAEYVVTAQEANTDHDFGNTIYAIYPGPDAISSATVKKIKFRFSLAGPKLPVKVLYDIYNVTDSAAVSTDNEFTLNDGTPSQEVELPLTSDKAIRIQNIRFFCDPFHV